MYISIPCSKPAVVSVICNVVNLSAQINRLSGGNKNNTFANTGPETKHLLKISFLDTHTVFIYRLEIHNVLVLAVVGKVGLETFGVTWEFPEEEIPNELKREQFGR